MTETTTICKICGGAAPVFTSVDFEKHCNKQLTEGRFAGTPVAYYRCARCHFMFTPFLDDLSPAELVARVYNEDYIKFDPLYPVIRPRMNAGFLREIVEEALPPGPIRILDYGAGNGMLSQLLDGAPPVENYDALNPRFDRLPDGRFDLLFCSEVVEHIPDPHGLIADWDGLLNEQGAVIFSTMTQPDDIASLRGDWWYLGPRNGHVSLYSRYSLDLLCQQRGLSYVPIDAQWHLAAREPGQFVDVARLKAVADRLPKGFIEV
ncbi:MAG TPA: class I SAM-dependent methyltransferase [Acidisoma sp.]|uniref:class I SAM-dependent methyltransferase n=1 Tax=Acidisoma sp. TaxID=1872115 RepID=UPI002BB2723A|nr:class I SAM-dependent methyltransferase [Acidisoma sp.]HTI01563.1 class I SAM-dependent methyltransferase [Acidisoma sp.]